MKFSFRVTFAGIVLALVLVYVLWKGFRMPAHENKVTFREKSWITLKSMISPPPHTTVAHSTWNRLTSQFTNDSIRVMQQSSADITTLDILNIIDRERRFGAHAAATTAPSSEELSEGLPLKVIVVPHSHNDPGWHKTVDSYFEDQTRQTLDNMLEKLQQYPNMTFVWAETVFFSMWWSALTHEKRFAVLQLLSRGQLEIVGGSWVVPDEANPHYFGLIDQMIEGHQWLKDNTRYFPTNTWSLDPFGYSAVMAHLYKLAGFENMVILRVHTAVKQHIQSRHSLEFMWRSVWNYAIPKEIMTLMMPYMLYNIKHSCGPDPNVCIQFDFRRISGEVSEARAATVHSGNVDRLSKLLLRQYQLKARLFPHNVVLVPLGDDFRYDHAVEWDQQFKNYMQLFKHMNSKTEWNVHARFGTIKDYFEEVKMTMTKLNINISSLTGDFFPYTDRNDEFWTGYFSTRPFAKSLCRDLEVFLRNAEIMHSLALATDTNQLYQRSMNVNKLVNVRRNLALFQHHDGITGTSRSWVADDYETRLQTGLQLSKEVIRSAAGFLLSNESAIVHPVNVLDSLSAHMLSPNEHLIHVTRLGIRLQVFNNVVHQRHELIHLSVNNQYVLVLNDRGQPVASQVTPAVVESSEQQTSTYVLSFVVELLPLSISTFDVLPANVSTVGHSYISKNSTYIVSRSVKQQDVMVENDFMKAAFSLRTGLLQAVRLKHENRLVHSSLEFLFYTSRRSGAYIFAPTGPAEHCTDKHKVKLEVFSGPVFTEVRLVRAFVTHWARIIHCDCSLAAIIELNTIVDLNDMGDKELIVRLNSDVLSGNIFYTDQNGFQMMKRQHFSTFPIEANYYPATSAVFIQDDELRMSFLLTQPSGVSSQTEGSLEVMLDRKLFYDDNRGMGEGVEDNKRVFFRHHLLIEPVVRKLSGAKHILPMPTLLAHTLIHRLRHQPLLMLSPLTSDHKPPLLLLTAQFSCDTVLVNLRAISAKKSALILHRVGHGSEYSVYGTNKLLECPMDFQPVTLSSIFRHVRFRYVVEKTLSLMHSIKRHKKDVVVHLYPMQLSTFEVYL